MGILNNVLDISNEMCTGCGVCFKICPKKSITITKSNLGFYNPIIDDSCIHCGLCKKVCYKFFSNDIYSIKNTKGYLAYNSNEKIRKISSSGGISNQIAEWGIDNGYTIIGVEYNYKKNIAEHILIDNKLDLYKIIGSKYIPSWNQKALNMINPENKYIIFGTPCQIYGLRKYIELKNIKNIILVDFFCHGTPSLNLWDRYIEYVHENYSLGTIKSINFRDKSKGWHTFSMRIEGENGIYTNDLNNDVFFNFFLMNYCFPKSCGECKLRFNKLASDIRIADFWGEKCKNDEKGTSIVLVNNKIGNELIGSLNNIYLEEISYSEIEQSQKIDKIEIPKKREEVLNKLCEKCDMRIMYKKYPLKLKRKRNIEYNTIKVPIRLINKIKDSIYKNK